MIFFSLKKWESCEYYCYRNYTILFITCSFYEVPKVVKYMTIFGFVLAIIRFYDQPHDESQILFFLEKNEFSFSKKMFADIIIFLTFCEIVIMNILVIDTYTKESIYSRLAAITLFMASFACVQLDMPNYFKYITAAVGFICVVAPISLIGSVYVHGKIFGFRRHY